MYLDYIETVEFQTLVLCQKIIAYLSLFIFMVYITSIQGMKY